MADVSFEMGLVPKPLPEFPCGHWTRKPGMAAIQCGEPSKVFFAAVNRPDLKPRARCLEHRETASVKGKWKETAVNRPGEMDEWREISYNEAVVFTLMVR